MPGHKRITALPGIQCATPIDARRDIGMFRIASYAEQSGFLGLNDFSFDIGWEHQALVCRSRPAHRLHVDVSMR